VTVSAPTTGRRGVIVGLWVAVAQTVALAIAAAVTGSAAMKTQTATNLADVAVGLFLLIGVVSSDRPADDRHPLGYGRERFFWSFIAAVGIFIGGFGAAVAETLQTALHPRPTGSYLLGYIVLATVMILDAVALAVGLRPVRTRADARRMRVAEFLWRGTDPAVTTVVVSSVAGLAGGLVAALGLAGLQVTGEPVTDVAASALIGLILLSASVVLLHTNRELLTGRGVSPALVAHMRDVVAGQAGVVAVPDIFAIVVGPSSLIVDGDVVFEDDLGVPEVEAIIVAAAAAMRHQWPSISYVYLNPVSARRPRRGVAAPRSATSRRNG
jgi:cation diffusion facilitator family transporter